MRPSKRTASMEKAGTRRSEPVSNIFLLPKHPISLSVAMKTDPSATVDSEYHKASAEISRLCGEKQLAPYRELYGR